MRGQPSALGDTRVAPNGYHYTRVQGGWKLTHHIVAEEQLGRPIGKDERVCFNDNDRTNLHPDNIVVKKKNVPSKASRVAKLEARLDELKAELEELNAE